MKKQRFLSLLLVLALLLATMVIPAAAAEADQPEGTIYRPEESGEETEVGGGTDSAAAYTTAAGLSLNCQAAILVDQDTGAVLYSYDPDERDAPCSTTKLMTAYLCMKYGNINDQTVVTSSAMSGLESASTAGMYVGEKYTVYQLLVAMLLPSGCDAANVIGEYVAGSTSAFVALMNQEAAALGCRNTHFANCHGVPTSNHYMSVSDMATIARAALQYETIRQIVSSHQITIDATNMHAARTFTNTNSLLPDSGSSYAYPYATGAKTGSAAGMGIYNAVFTAEKNGVRLLGVIFGAPSGASRWSQATAMLDWGFENYHPNQLSSADCSVTLSQNSYTYDGNTHYPAVSVSYNGKTLTQGTDYTLSYTGGQMIGTASVKVTGIGNYSGSREVSYQIVSPMPFTDVLPTAWYWNTVLQGWQQGLVSGMTATTFEPGYSTTRGMAVTVLYRYFGSPAVTEETSFTDLKQQYYIAPITWAQTSGIVNGRSETVFAPDDNISRQDFVTILYRLEQEPETTYDLSGFRDADAIAGYARNAFRWAVENGIINGRSSTELAPGADISRAEMVTMLIRYQTLKAAQQ